MERIEINRDDRTKWGFISKEYTVMCANCGEWQSYSAENKRETSQLARKDNWKFVEADGWICPDCYEECWVE